MDQGIAWAANIVLIAGLYFLSPRRRWPLALTAIGETTWFLVGVYRGQADIAFICLVFAALSVRNFLHWDRP